MVKRPTEEDYVVMCCEDFRFAFQQGTDNEGYGSLFGLERIGEEGMHVGGGCHGGKIIVCPFCGKPVQFKAGVK